MLIAEHKNLLASFSSALPPMIHPPRDWNADNLGPYLAPELQVAVQSVRNMSPEQADVDRMTRSGDLDAVYEALNFVQSTIHYQYIHIGCIELVVGHHRQLMS